MPGIRTNAAAEVLGVSPNTLRSWERRYGFPTPKRTEGNHRNYELVELQTLRDALAQTGNISSAIELARQRQSAPASGGNLVVAMESFDEEAANRAVEESLALRPLERTVEELAPLYPRVLSLAIVPVGLTKFRSQLPSLSTVTKADPTPSPGTRPIKELLGDTTPVRPMRPSTQVTAPMPLLQRGDKTRKLSLDRRAMPPS